jgi:hypothetical protein
MKKDVPESSTIGKNASINWRNLQRLNDESLPSPDSEAASFELRHQTIYWQGEPPLGSSKLWREKRR